MGVGLGDYSSSPYKEHHFMKVTQGLGLVAGSCEPGNETLGS